MNTVALSEIADQVRGVSYGKGDVVDSPSDGYLPVLRANNITEEGLDLSDLVFVRSDKVGERQKVRSGDIVIAASSGSISVVGKAAQALTDLEAGFGAFCKVVRPSGRVDHRYLGHYFRTPAYRQKMSALAAGANINNLKNEHIDELVIPLPPVEEQKRIAAILDQADELRRKRQRALDRLNQLGQAIFIEMFGDPKKNPKGLPWTRLDELADFYSGNTLPEGEPFSGQEGGHLLLKVSDLNHALNQQDIICAANWSASPGSRAGTCPPEVLVFPKRGGAIGTNKKRWLRRSAILDPNLMGVHPDQSRLTMSFLCGWFETFNLSDIASGSSVPQLNKQDLAPLQLALPPIAEQAAFAKRVEELSSLRQGLAKGFSCDMKLFEVLQHRAFRGKL